MVARVVRLGTTRREHEGLRIGTVRHPPRGVPKKDWSARDYFDVWFPVLAPSSTLVKEALTATEPAQWQKFVRGYRREMKTPQASQALELLAALSHQTNFALGCYCEDEARCHRSILRELLLERGGDVA